ncbi:PxKF domain-containing protein [Lysobacter korlensis]|uniref:PxKF domain-containing protein n=1 Tax=Lysobacter korlensis TaxID=553636 RepID=A0ABV6RN29_9GAMM
MTRTTRRMGIGSSILALTTASVLALGGVAHADYIQDTIADNGIGLSLVAGSTTAGTAAIKVLNQNTKDDGDSVNQCNLAGKVDALILDIKPPAGVTADPARLTITACDTQYPVKFTASATAESGNVTALVVQKPAGEFLNEVSIPITIVKPNTKPTVSITGVTAGTEYKSNAVPTPGCTFTDTEDGTGPATMQVSNPPANGLGSHTVTCDYTDKGGLAADRKTVTYTVVAANTKPSVGVTGVTAGSKYEIGEVPPAICEITDAEDSNDTAPAVLSGSLVHGLGQQTATCDYTDQGGLKADTASVTYTIVDTGKPTIEGKTDPGAPTGLNGWYNSSVDVKFTCADTGSGIDSCTGDTTLGNGANQSVTGTAKDFAGNTSTDTVSGINVDSLKPTIDGATDPGAPTGANGWYNSSVDVKFTCADTGSGIDSCTGDTTLGDGANQSVTGTATDLAGNTATDTVSGINVDSVKPTIVGKLDPAAADGANGWYTSDVKVSFACADTGSGIATCTGDETLGEGAGQSVSGTATDVAGNTTTGTVSNIHIDKTAPGGIVVSGVSSYMFGSGSGVASCTATDAGSGIASCVVTGFGATTVGSHTAVATATDVAGLTSTKTVSYTVTPWKATGFYSPVDMGGVVNTVKGGSTVPLKFEVFGATEFTSTAVVKSFTQKQFTCSSGAVVDEIEVVSTGKTELRYDAVAGQFIQNWQTPKSAGVCYLVNMTLQDGTSLVASFKLK